MKCAVSVLAIFAIFMWPDVVPWFIVMAALIYVIALVFRE